MIAIDLGSNTIRFIEYDGITWGKSFEKIVKTAESLQNTQQVNDAAIERIIDAINEAKKNLDFSNHEVIGYTTAAMRLALNTQSVLEKIASKTGVFFTIIDAEKEAALTLNAVRYRMENLHILPDAFVLADIGGGSTELIRFENNQSHSISLNTGIVTLSESVNSPAELESRIQQFKQAVRESFLQPSSFQLVLTAGTPTTISAYLLGMDYQSYDPNKINGFRLCLEDCYRVYHDLLQMDETTRQRYVGVGRENLIMAGILMVTSIYEALNCEEAIIIDDGLREGIALEYYL